MKPALPTIGSRMTPAMVGVLSEELLDRFEVVVRGGEVGRGAAGHPRGSGQAESGNAGSRLHQECRRDRDNIPGNLITLSRPV